MGQSHGGLAKVERLKMKLEIFQTCWLVIASVVAFAYASPARNSSEEDSGHGTTLEEIDKSKDQIIARLETQVEKNEYTLGVLEKRLQIIIRALETLETDSETEIVGASTGMSKDQLREMLESKLEKKENKLYSLENSIRKIISGLESTNLRNTDIPLVDIIRGKDKIIKRLKTKIENQEKKISAAESKLKAILASLVENRAEFASATNNIDHIIENLKTKNEMKDEKISGIIARINGVISVIGSNETKANNAGQFYF